MSVVSIGFQRCSKGLREFSHLLVFPYIFQEKDLELVLRGIVHVLVVNLQVDHKGKIHGKLNASWKISSLAVNGQSFLVIDGYLLDFL